MDAWQIHILRGRYTFYVAVCLHDGSDLVADFNRVALERHLPYKEGVGSHRIWSRTSTASRSSDTCRIRKVVGAV